MSVTNIAPVPLPALACQLSHCLHTTSFTLHNATLTSTHHRTTRCLPSRTLQVCSCPSHDYMRAKCFTPYWPYSYTSHNVRYASHNVRYASHNFLYTSHNVLYTSHNVCYASHNVASCCQETLITSINTNLSAGCYHSMLVSSLIYSFRQILPIHQMQLMQQPVNS